MARGQSGGYPPEFAALIQKAFHEEVSITCESMNQAHAFRHRLNNYRRYLRTADPEFSRIAEQVEFAIRPNRAEMQAEEQFGRPAPPPTVIARPRGGIYAELIRGAGIDPDVIGDEAGESGSSTAETDPMLAALEAFRKSGD